MIEEIRKYRNEFQSFDLQSLQNSKYIDLYKNLKTIIQWKNISTTNRTSAEHEYWRKSDYNIKTA